MGISLQDHCETLSCSSFFHKKQACIFHRIHKNRRKGTANNRNNEFSETVTVIPLTSKILKIYPFETFICKEEIEMLDVDSKAKCNQIRTIDKRRLIKFLGKLPQYKIEEIEVSLKIHLGL